ncbi:hypothetical protein JCM8547_008742 [Rhodosporidiobolus lusitaniae]
MLEVASTTVLWTVDNIKDVLEAAVEANAPKILANTIVIRAIISKTPYLPTASLEPPPSPGLVQAFEGFLNDPSGSDIAFVFKRDVDAGISRSIAANKRFLAARSSYFRTMFDGGFSEGVVTSSSSNSSTTAEQISRKDSAAWDNDDDGFEWVPAAYAELHGLAAAQDDGVQDMESGEVSMEDADGTESVKKIQIVDAGFTTYRAMLFFLYTNRIVFQASNFLVFLASSSSSPFSPVSPASSPGGDSSFHLSMTPRRDFLLRGLGKHADSDLKEEAKEAILDGFTVDNILYELVSSFFYHVDDVKSEALKYAWQNWDEVKATAAFPRVVAGAPDIEGGSEILTQLLMRFSTLPKPMQARVACRKWFLWLPSFQSVVPLNGLWERTNACYC